MQAGRLDRRITLYRQGAPADDGFTSAPGPWAELASVSASFEPLSDGERVRQQQVGATVSARFQIRWSSVVADLSAEDQLEFEGRRFAISHVKPIGRKVGLELTAGALAERPSA